MQKCKSCLISHFEEKPYQEQADIVVDTLSELKQLLIKTNSECGLIHILFIKPY